MKDASRTSGPAIWLVTIGITTLLLVAATKALWLVVPFLVAIILYYILLPIVHRLVAVGVGREAAAALVAGGVTLLAVGTMIPLLPWLVAQSVAGEQTLYRYLEGGRVLVDRTLVTLESQFAFLKRIGFHAEMSRKAAEFGDTFVQKQLSETLRGAAVVAALAAARAILRVLLPARRPQLPEAPDRAGCPTHSSSARSTCSIVSTRPPATTSRDSSRSRRSTSLVLGVGLWLIGVPGALFLGVASCRAGVGPRGGLDRRLRDGGAGGGDRRFPTIPGSFTR